MSFLSGIGPIKARQIIEKLNDVSQLFELTPHQLSKLTDIPKNVFVKMKPKQALEEAEKTLEFNFKNKIQTILFEENEEKQMFNFSRVIENILKK